MAVIKPFRALRPRPDNAKDISSVPYDVVTTEEARRLAEGNPLSYLHVTRAEIDMPAGTDPYDDSVYEKARETFDSFTSRGILIEEARPCLYLYRLAAGAHEQTGLACLCSVDEYDRNVIKKHEHTRKEKEDDRLRNMIALRAHAEPVLMAFRGNSAVDALFAEENRGNSPLFDFVSNDGVRNTLWRVKKPAPFVETIEKTPALYIADGHHRAAASSRLRRHGVGEDGEERDYFLAVLFPAEQLRILPYNRYVSDLNGMGAREFIEAVKRKFAVVQGDYARPSAGRVFGMYLQGNWYELRLRDGVPKGGNPVSNLDLSVFHETLLRPVLGILDQTKDGRIDFVGGEDSSAKLRRRVDEEGGVAFTFHPVSLEELLAVADAGMIMPPKSTWFSPKLRSGLLIHRF